jgi:hypothetical protein
MRRFFLVCALLTPISTVATAIFAVRTATFIEIAADSKPTRAWGTGPRVVCKVYRSGQTYFAIGNLAKDPRRAFYVNAIIAPSLAGSDFFSEKMMKAGLSLSEPTLNEMLRLRAEDKASFDKILKRSNDVVSVILAEYRDGIPYLGLITLTFVSGPKPSIVPSYFQCPGSNSGRNCSLVSTMTIGSGFTDEGNQYMRENPNSNIEERLRRAVEIEIQTHPKRRHADYERLELPDRLDT